MPITTVVLRKCKQISCIYVLFLKNFVSADLARQKEADDKMKAGTYVPPSLRGGAVGAAARATVDLSRRGNYFILLFYIHVLYILYVLHILLFFIL